MDLQSNTFASQQGMALLHGVVPLGRRKYAVSLLWNMAEGNGKLLQEAKIAAERMGSTLLALRPGHGVWNDQFAIGDSQLGHSPKLPSLAAALAEQLNGSLLGVWLLDDNVWWLVGVRSDGSIVYDRAVADVDEIRAEFDNARLSDKWEEIICPADFYVENSLVGSPLGELIGTSKVRLRPLKKSLTPMIATAVVISLLVGASLYGYQQYQAHLAELERLKARSAGTPHADDEIVVPPMPWAGKPQASATLKACVKGLLVYANEANKIPGWSQGVGRCDGKSVTFSLIRSGGTNSWLQTMAARLPSKPAVAEGDRESSLVWSLSDLPRYAPDSPGVSVKKAQRYLQTEFDELFTPIQFTSGQKELYWTSTRYALKDTPNPSVYLPLFGKIPASLIQEVTFDPHTNYWSLSGEIYERLQPTAQELENLKNSRGY